LRRVSKIFVAIVIFRQTGLREEREKRIESGMGTKDPRVDSYIAKSADFAKPILSFLRAVVHEAAPEITEEMKWSFPHFTRKGIVCSMAAFKEHCSFGFWQRKLVVGKMAPEGMGQFGKIRAVTDLPKRSDLLGYVRKAVQLNETGSKKPSTPKPKVTPVRVLTVPEDLAGALKKNAAARKNWEGFSYSHKKEYVEWITEAKREETRQKRLATTLEWLVDGKPRHWKYQNC
jgi:uncharacterized protein YdeI (YjbR/CyaY-like superfamily)